MPAVAWIDKGYQGFGPPQLELLLAHLWDYRYGLFASCPIFILALALPFLNRGGRRILAARLLGRRSSTHDRTPPGTEEAGKMTGRRPKSGTRPR